MTHAELYGSSLHALNIMPTIVTSWNIASGSDSPDTALSSVLQPSIPGAGVIQSLSPQSQRAPLVPGWLVAWTHM
jgi:hypothetical protein